MIRVILLYAAITIASVGGDNNTDNNSTSDVSKREILEFYPDWVPFKNKHGDELGEFVDVTKPKAKVKKRLALPMNFLIKAVADDDSGDYIGQGESDGDEYFDKKDWSDINRPVHNVSESVPEQNKISDIDGLLDIITKGSSLADDINKTIPKAEDASQDDDDIPEKKETITELAEEPTSTAEPELRIPLTPRSNIRVYTDEEDDSESANKGQQQSQEDSQKLSPEEQKENEEKKRIILDSVDQLKLRHEQEQRAISAKTRQDEYDNKVRHRKINRSGQRYRLTTSPPNYDEYEDLSWKNKYNVNVETKTTAEDRESPVIEDDIAKRTITKKTTTTTTYKPVDPERAKYSLFKNPDLYTIDDNEGEITLPKKTANTPRRFSSKYSSAENNIVNSATTTEKVEPILYFPKMKPKRKLKKPKHTTTEAPDSYVAETVEDKLTNKQTTEPITYPDITSLANDDYKTTALGYDYPSSTVSLWKEDASASDNPLNEKSNLNPVRDSTAQYDETSAEVTGPSGEAEASNSETVVDAVPASSDHKKEEEPKDYHVKKGGGKEHYSSYEEEHEEHGKKAYEGLHKDTKTKKGHHDKEDHLGKYEDHGGHDKKHHDESGHYGLHKHEEHGKKHAKYEESGKHSKGHSTKGSHDIHKKEEYEKKVEFFEEEGDSKEEEKHGGYHNEKKHEAGGLFKKGKLHHDHHENKKGESGHFLKGGHHFVDKGHKSSDGHDGHGKHHGAHHNAGWQQHGKKWVYHHGTPAKNANLIVIDRRADRYMHGPNYYG